MIYIALCGNDKWVTPVIAAAARAAFEARDFLADIDTFTRGGTLMSALKKKPYDLILLDLDVPGQDGVEIGKRIKSLDHATPIVFVSECENRVFEALSAQPMSFVRKSNFLSDIVVMADLFQKRRETPCGVNHVELKTRTSVVSLPLAQVRYIASDRNYQLVFLKNRKDPVEVKMTMENLEKELRHLGLIRIHKSYLVNYRFIRRIDTTSVTLEDGSKLPVGRNRAHDIRSRYLALRGQGKQQRAAAAVPSA